MYWTVHLNGTPHQAEHAAVTVGENIYFFGGYCRTEVTFKVPISVYVLNTRTYRWTSLPYRNEKNNEAQPYTLRGHSAAVYGRKVYIWGGRNFEGETNELLCFDTDTSTWSWPEVTGNIPHARYGHSACIIENCMYIFGGEHSSQAFQSNEVYCFDLLTSGWKRIYTSGDPPPCVSYSCVEVVGRRMYVFGGISTEYYPDVMILDTVSQRWYKPLTSGNTPPPRGKHSTFFHNNYFYVYGGYDAENNLHYDDLHRFHIEKNQWELVKTLGEKPKARKKHSSLLVGDRVFMFGGTSSYRFFVGTDAVVFFYRDDLHVLDLSPSLRTLCLMVVLEHKLDIEVLPENLKDELSLMSPDKTVIIYA